MSREMGTTLSELYPMAYFERFGAFGGRRESGLVSFALTHAMREAWAGRMQGTLDTIALVLTAMEQANMDGGRWEVASLFLLLPDPPAHTLSRPLESSSLRQFPRIADQSWSTTMLSYIREMDTMQQRRVGAAPGRQSQPRVRAGGGADGQDAVAETTAVARAKGKAKGKN